MHRQKQLIQCSLKYVLPLMLAVPTWVAAQPPTTKTAEVMVTISAKPGVIRDQIVKLASEEVRATVRLYLDGKIRDWFSRSDGKGVILIVNAASVDEARTLADTLPLAKANLVEHEFVELGPLAPLNNLLGAPPVKQ